MILTGGNSSSALHMAHSYVETTYAVTTLLERLFYSYFLFYFILLFTVQLNMGLGTDGKKKSDSLTVRNFSLLHYRELITDSNKHS
ncbi:hypothetical protein XENTR_v10011477 [Xenopus tropicalis]|nr:hypothetical protein XENTR_v10011477 [Xenopus tropicalis]